MRRSLLLIAVIAACGGDDTISTPPAMNPLGTTENILPYPSSLYERADAASPTGVVLDLPGDAIPIPEGGAALDTDARRITKRTGWPAALTILWAAPGGVDPATLVGHEKMGDSVGASSSTVILDMTTGQRVAHFAEVDVNETEDLDHQAVYLRPAKRLAGGHRFAVGIRTSVKAVGGTDIARSTGFQAVLDDKSIGHARLDQARPRLREAVAALEAAGIPRSELIVAFDFTVAADAAAIADPLAARDAALAAMGPLGANLTYTVTSNQGTVGNDPRIARRIELDVQVPRVTGDANAGFLRGGDGRPMVQGTLTAKAYVMVPPCATAQNRAGILMYGHGFFGGLDEVRGSEYLRDLSQEGCYVVAGTVWVGMSSDDVPNALLALNNLDRGFGFGEHIFQGVVDFIALEQLLRGKLATELLVDGAQASVVDPTNVVFLGISQGHILGSTFFAYDPFISRAVLHVGGANWSLMFERSNNWLVYGAPLKGAYSNLLNASIMEQVLEMALEPVDGATVTDIAIPNTPTKQLLMQTSMHDPAVPNLASFLQARSLGLTLLTPSVYVPYGFETAQGTSSSRAYVIVDEHPTPIPPETNELFSFDNVAHENPRRRSAIQQMMRDFWRTGSATNTCAGACDCASGACGTLRMATHGGS